MSEVNIYEAPVSVLVEKNMAREADEYLRTIALQQKYQIYAFLVSAFLVVALEFASAELWRWFPQNDVLLYLAILLTILPIGVFHACLSWKLYGPVRRVLMIALGVIPVINFVIVLIASLKASSTLKKSGLAIGLMGANLS